MGMNGDSTRNKQIMLFSIFMLEFVFIDISRRRRASDCG